MQLLQKNYANWFWKDKDKTNIWKDVLVFSIFTALFVWFKWDYHELWKDEWQAWHDARDMSWGQLFSFLYYEGHPSLWYVYLKLVTYITPNGYDLEALQTAHILITISAFVIFFFRFRLQTYIKIAFLLGFFCFFEYGIVNRGYSLVMLLAFWITINIERWQIRVWPLFVGFILLCQTEAQGVIIGGILWCYLFLEQTKNTNWSDALRQKELQLLLGSLAIGVLLFIITVFPRGEAEDLAKAYNLAKQPLSESIPLAFQGLLANTFWIGSIKDTGAFGVSKIGILFAIIILLGLYWLFRKEKMILATMGLGLLAFFCFAAFVYGGGVRQWGMLWVLFMIILHLFAHKNPHVDFIQGLILYSFLGFNVYYNVLATEKEYNYPFSNAARTAAFIKKNAPSQVPIVAIDPFKTGPVVGYLGKDIPVYKMPEGERFTWFKWLSKVYIPSENELQLFAQYKGARGLVVISGEPLPASRFPKLNLIKNFDTYSIKNESFYVYTLQR